MRSSSSEVAPLEYTWSAFVIKEQNTTQISSRADGTTPTRKLWLINHLFSWSLWPWGRFRQGSFLRVPEMCVPRLSVLPSRLCSRSRRQQAELLGSCLRPAEEADEGRAEAALVVLRKQQVNSNVAVATGYYFLSFSSHFLGATYFFLLQKGLFSPLTFSLERG